MLNVVKFKAYNHKFVQRTRGRHYGLCKLRLLRGQILYGQQVVLLDHA